MLKNFIWGLIILVSGVGLVVYARKLVEWFGTMDWAERRLGSGGTYTVIRIIGIIASLVGLLLATGLLDNTVIGFAKFIGVIK